MPKTAYPSLYQGMQQITTRGLKKLLKELETPGTPLIFNGDVVSNDSQRY